MAENVTTKKRDVASQINEVAQDFMKFVEREFPEFCAYFDEKTRESIVGLLNVEKPKVMVYGIYNSGKSTLINALCKECVAEVADRPMTDRISEYDRGDYYLIDSPGVDAPIQHELVTEDYLNKCHVILFVISSKGMFEDRSNYEKLARLIQKEVPFIIVLNDRGCPIGKGWDDERKKRAKFDHEQELNKIQYKIIDNLIKITGNDQIVDKYEVVILNAKQAWTGVDKNKVALINASKVDQLDQRISQLLSNDVSLSMLFKQPLINMNECLGEVEKMIVQTMSGDSSDDFGLRLQTLQQRKSNIMDDMEILIRQTVKSRIDELAQCYLNGDPESYISIAEPIFDGIEGHYVSKLNELLVYIDHNFKELGLSFDTTSNICLDFVDTEGSVFDFAEGSDAEPMDAGDIVPEKKPWYDFLKSRKKREKEKQERLEREARLQNERVQYYVQEKMRKRQEARQAADRDLDALYRECRSIVSKGMDEKYNNIIDQIRQIDEINQEMKETGERQISEVRKLRERMTKIENTLVME